MPVRLSTRRQLVLSATALAALVSPDWAFAQVTVGQPAPAFSLVAADGKTVALESLWGKTVVLEWTRRHAAGPDWQGGPAVRSQDHAPYVCHQRPGNLGVPGRHRQHRQRAH